MCALDFCIVLWQHLLLQLHFPVVPAWGKVFAHISGAVHLTGSFSFDDIASSSHLLHHGLFKNQQSEKNNDIQYMGWLLIMHWANYFSCFMLTFKATKCKWIHKKIKLHKQPVVQKTLVIATLTCLRCRKFKMLPTSKNYGGLQMIIAITNASSSNTIRLFLKSVHTIITCVFIKVYISSYRHHVYMIVNNLPICKPEMCSLLECISHCHINLIMPPRYSKV